jgi:hypothetical protein
MKSNPFDKYLTEEDRLHIGLLDYIRLQYPKALVHHSANEGKRSPFERYKIKKLGLKKGFPDLIIIYNGRNLALELKTEKGKPSEDQEAWINGLQAHGWTGYIAYGFDEAKQAIDKFFKS